MTMWELIGALRRRWGALVVGAFVSVLLVSLARSQEPVYNAELNVSLVADVAYSDLRQPDPSLVIVASLIAEQVNERDSPPTSTDAVNLVGEGVRHGWSVTLPNSGGQWSRRNDKSQLRVQAVGATEAEVRSLLNVATRRIDGALASLQRPHHIRRAEQIRAETLALAPIVHVNAGSSSRAGAAAMILGVFVSVAVALTLDRLCARRLRRPPGPST